MPALNSSAVMWSSSGAQRDGRPMLVLLHGRGSHEGDLFGLSPRLPLAPVIASVRAPIPEGGGYSWFESSSTPGDVGGDEADAAARALLDWLDTIDTSGGVGLLGFSQGAVVAVQALRLEPRRFDYAVALSGYVAREDSANDPRLPELPPPVFWGRGDADEVIPSASVEWSIPWLATHTRLTERVYENLGHGVSEAEIKDIARFIIDRLSP